MGISLWSGDVHNAWKTVVMHNGNRGIDAEGMCCKLLVVAQSLLKSLPPPLHISISRKNPV